MKHSMVVALLLLGACSGETRGTPAERPNDEPPNPEGPSAPEPPAPPREATWLRELLAFDLRAEPTDQRMIALGQQLGSNVACPQPGTGCFIELELAGHTTQVHMGGDQALQIWGPTEPLEMPQWVSRVERTIDASALTPINPAGERPDRLWRDARHVVLLHDHSVQPCGGFCPAMIWIAPPDHPSASGYGFDADRP